MWVESSILQLAKPSPIEELIFELEISNHSLEALLGDPLSGIMPHTGRARTASFLTKKSFPALRRVKITTRLPWNRLHVHQTIGRREMNGMNMKWAFIVSDVYHWSVLSKGEILEEEGQGSNIST
ncbi:hypothetical protein H2248_011517 [Termitomyces sp. 'cryptogamus']|nr:hypothetical protein H2248_011517 [Termitomyces sp. 'cryptogamus']